MEHIAIIEDSLKRQESQDEALKILLSLSTDNETLALIASSKNLVRELVSLATEEKTANTALQILINFAQNQKISEIMVDNGVFHTLFDYLSKCGVTGWGLGEEKSRMCFILVKQYNFTPQEMPNLLYLLTNHLTQLKLDRILVRLISICCYYMNNILFLSNQLAIKSILN